MDLSTNYMGLRLHNPLVAGASPLSREVDRVRALEDAGISAVVMYSLFEEQLVDAEEESRHFEDFGADSYAEALSYLPSMDCFERHPDEYVRHLERLKAVVDIPIIASLNGSSDGGWIDYARQLEAGGADGLELNLYQLATDPSISAAGVENRYIDALDAVKRTVSIPIAVKLSPYFSSLAHFAKRLDERGADALVLFNRFYQPDIDLEALEVVPDLVLSARHEMRLPLRWVAILDPQIEASLGASTGITTFEDVLKFMMVGADVTMLCGALLRQGIVPTVSDMLTRITEWLHEHEYESLHQLQGSMNYETCGNPGAFERANYLRALSSYD